MIRIGRHGDERDPALAQDGQCRVADERVDHDHAVEGDALPYEIARVGRRDDERPIPRDGDVGRGADQLREVAQIAEAHARVLRERGDDRDQPGLPGHEARQVVAKDERAECAFQCAVEHNLSAPKWRILDVHGARRRPHVSSGSERAPGSRRQVSRDISSRRVTEARRDCDRRPGRPRRGQDSSYALTTSTPLAISRAADRLPPAATT